MRNEAEPQTRGLILLTLHRATLELFGEDGLRAIGAALPPDVRTALIDTPPIALSWYPTSYVVAWWKALVAGPGNDEAAFRAFVDRSNDLGFGRVRKALLGFVGPTGLVSRAADLWRHDHTTGTLEVHATLENGVKAVLRDHPFVETDLARRAITEALRYILSLARGVRSVTATHTMEGGTLVMTFLWS